MTNANFIYPELVGVLGDNSVATLKTALLFFDDMILKSDYYGGKLAQTYPVHAQGIAKALSDMSFSTGILPPNCMYYGVEGGKEQIILWVPPQMWRVLHRGGEKGVIDTPLPAFLFCGTKKDYGLVALASDSPPMPHDRVYRMPLPNIGESSLCTGTSPFPVAALDTMYPALDVLFASQFNDHSIVKKSKDYPDSVVDLLAGLHAQGAMTYPVHDLIEIPGLTVADVPRRVFR